MAPARFVFRKVLVQMIPVAGLDMYQKLMKTNVWACEFLPNAFMESGSLLPKKQEQAPALHNLLEIPLRGKIGGKFESWEMTRKIARFSKQSAFGEETIFTAEVCQGNFHHHRKWTREVFEERLSVIARSSALSGVSDSERRRSVDDEAIPSFKEIASLPSVARNDKARL